MRSFLLVVIHFVPRDCDSFGEHQWFASQILGPKLDSQKIYESLVNIRYSIAKKVSAANELKEKGLFNGDENVTKTLPLMSENMVRTCVIELLSILLKPLQKKKYRIKF